MRRLESYFSDILEHTQQVVYLKRADGRYLYVNRQFERVSHLSRAAVLGRRDEELFPPAIAAVFKEQDRRVLEARQACEWEETLLLPDGPQTFITCKFPLLGRDGAPWAVGGSCCDITARKKAEGRLAFSESLLAQAEAVAGIGSFHVDVSTMRSIRSSGLNALLGCEPDPDGHAALDYLDRVHPDDRPRLLEAIEAGKASGQGFQCEFRLSMPDGSERTLRSESQPLEAADGAGPRFIGWVLDITERRRLERELFTAVERERRRIGRDLHDDLGQRLAGAALLAGALERRAAEGERADPAIASRIARELRDAMACLRLLARGLHPVPARPEGLCDALSDLARASAVDRVRAVFRSRGRPRVEDPEIAGQLFRIAQEAVGNALRHGRPSSLVISLRASRRALALVVEDDGAGFDEGSASRGLGLDIMRLRAELIRGTLTIDSRPGRGTRLLCRVHSCGSA